VPALRLQERRMEIDMLLWAGTVGWGLLFLALWWREFRPATLFAIGMVFLVRVMREMGIVESNQVATINSFTPLIGLFAVLDATAWRYIRAH